MTVPRRVSIGIPTINRSSLALRAIRSALSQTYSDVEVIVSDDASTDDTVARVQEIRDPRLVLVQQKERLGLVGNFDFCLRQATGEFFLLAGRRRCAAAQRHRTISRAIPAGQSFHSRQRDRRCLVPLSNCQHHKFSVLDHRSRPRNRICLFPARCAVCRRSRSSAHQHFAPYAGCDCGRRLRQ